ncbi:hypothetical protein [Micromonospora gifhornensis]|uniref:hypothetical protein n=1 Tax=Micromonospora gifhornensis TaxID=84594 RepID=UPI001EF3BAC2|nr:hypothetical protein [Micromonospora gifhornensis]
MATIVITAEVKRRTGRIWVRARRIRRSATTSGGSRLKVTPSATCNALITSQATLPMSNSPMACRT